MQYTEQAQRALKYARDAAKKCGQNYIGSEHLLLGLLREERGMASAILHEYKADEGKLTQLIQELIVPEGMLMEHFLDDDFAPEYPEMVAAVRSEEYYINMMTAWYFATALAKQWDAVLPYIEGRRLDVWTHNKAIQKSIESRRITPEQKEYLRTLKIKKERAATRG